MKLHSQLFHRRRRMSHIRTRPRSTLELDRLARIGQLLPLRWYSRSFMINGHLLVVLGLEPVFFFLVPL